MFTGVNNVCLTNEENDTFNVGSFLLKEEIKS